jgi:ribosomal protein RSM22 (predicted rRNA methylase)
VLSKIQKLKELFDHSSAELRTDYWTPELLEIYSETLGERIRWKWKGFLENIKEKESHPERLFQGRGLQILDWGCGPGTASLAFAESCENKLNSFEFFDRSAEAMAFSQKRLAAFRSDMNPNSETSVKLLLVSYVLSELPKAEEEKLLEKIFSMDAFLWVDAGTHKESRRLGEIRNTLLSQFTMIDPCPHNLQCPLSGSANPQDWCHRFAKAPQEVFHSAKWSEISRELKIDLRSLPYASLYGIKKKFAPPLNVPSETRLGRPRVGKHEITLDFCTEQGDYARKKISKRENPDLFKKLRKE